MMLLGPSGLETPFVGMMLLTLLVWIYMYVRRLSWAAANPAQAQLITTPEKLAELVPEPINWASNNLKNLFELPVLFYAVCLYLMAANATDPIHVWCAWGFFVLRAAHSAVQCTVNILLLRFAIYFFASLCLWVMVVRVAATVW